MPTSVAITPIYVIDAEASLTFYRDVLGLEVADDIDFGEMRWLTLSLPESDHQILLANVDGHIAPPDREAFKAQVVKGNLAVFLSVDDVDATFERLRTAGAEVLQEPTDTSYGLRDAAVRDPSGNHLRMAQPLAA